MDAKKQRYSAKDLAALFRGSRRLRIAKGKRVETIELADARPVEAFEAVLGPSGNLRAPAARVGKDWLIGFDEDAWSALLG